MNKKIFGCIFVFFAGLCAFADFNRFNIPDSAEIRRAKAESWFFGELGQLREKKSEIEKCKGTQFDPELADAFLDLLNNDYEKIEEIRAKYNPEQ